MDGKTAEFLEDWDRHERALIECAKQAWAALGKGYDLDGWTLHDSHVIVGYGQPPRAHSEYQHAFLFRRQNFEGLVYEHLLTVAKAPWHTNIRWRGTQVRSRKQVVATFPIGQHKVRKAYADTF